MNYGNYRSEFFKSLVLLALISAGVPESISEGAKSIPALKTTVFPIVQLILKNQPTKNIHSFHLLYHRDALGADQSISLDTFECRVHWNLKEQLRSEEAGSCPLAEEVIATSAC